MLRLGSTAIGATTAWAVLLTVLPAGVAWLCGADGLVGSVAPWDVARLGALTLMWAAMMAAMLLPCAVLSLALQLRAPSTIAMAVFLTAGAALLHWTLESTALLGTPALGVALAAALFIIELRKWIGTPTTVLPALQMVALQLLVDPMSTGWMAVVLLWMLADLLLPDRAIILSGIQRVGRRVNCALAGFRLSPSR